ncbi:high mobility group B protein 9-like [Spinacia oleracea]|uniref:High mobility group B protein 9-like n=1 Tax=Spinacia oleracea TaxID=3562 RepID=A0ABM3QLB3_SPIOL|nr:high mobility group B protein 9-like [Spinacia oleracea]
MFPASVKDKYNYLSPVATHEEIVNQPLLFLETLKSFHSMLGSKFMVPVIGRKELDLHVLYVEVTKRGGYIKVISEKKLREISSTFKFSATTTSASFVLKKHYLSLLYQYEQVYFFNVQGPIITTPPTGLCPNDNDKYAHERVEDSDSLGDIIPLSIPAVGTIHGKFECGYLVSVKLGHELLSGVIYHPVNMQCIPSSTTDDLRLAIVPYNPKQPRQASRKRRRKRKRWGGDPSHPKPNRSGYNFFFSEKHALLKSLYPNSREREFTKMIGELWNKLTSQDRIVYQDMGLRDKERYRTELQEYNAKLPAVKGNMIHRR